MKRFVLAVSLFLVTILHGQQPETSTKTSANLSWIREAAASSPSSEDARAVAVKSDPRFTSLLRSSLHQQQFFWRDHGQFTALPELVQLFVGVPGSTLVHEQRFVVLNGCVPHSCSARGMLWIDTQSTQPALIFVATDDVHGADSDKGAMIHLWLFSSTKLNWQQLPPSFTSSMGEWWVSTTKVWQKYYTERVTIVSLVQPSGEIVTLSPSLFHFAALDAH